MTNPIIKDMITVTPSDDTSSVDSDLWGNSESQGGGYFWRGFHNGVPGQNNDYNQVYIGEESWPKWYVVKAGATSNSFAGDEVLRAINFAGVDGGRFNKIYWFGRAEGFSSPVGDVIHVAGTDGHEVTVGTAKPYIEADRDLQTAINDPYTLFLFATRSSPYNIYRMTNYKDLRVGLDSRIIGIMSDAAGEVEVEGQYSRNKYVFTLTENEPLFFAVRHVYSTNTTNTGTIKLLLG